MAVRACFIFVCPLFLLDQIDYNSKRRFQREEQSVMKFYCHPTCTTCKKAQKWLEKQNIAYEFINLKETAPAKEELIKLMTHSNRPLKQFFNTSGQLYREYELKDKVSDMSIEAAAELLSENGMLIKRPLAIKQDKCTIGFKENEYEEVWISGEKENTK